MYEYNFEKEFPYTPNVRGVRTDDWSYMHYPNGEGQPDTEKAELYNIKNDPLETNNLIDAPEAQGTLAELKAELLKHSAGHRRPARPDADQPAASLRDARRGHPLTTMRGHGRLALEHALIPPAERHPPFRVRLGRNPSRDWPDRLERAASGRLAWRITE